MPANIHSLKRYLQRITIKSIVLPFRICSGFVYAKYIVLEKGETISIWLSPRIDRQRMRQPHHRYGLRYSRDHILLSDPVLR